MAFFGTPDIADVILQGILAAGTDEVVAVVCQPDRPKGRGQKHVPPPVKETAVAHGLEVTQPTVLKDGTLAEQMRGWNLDLAVVCAYGRIIPASVFRAPAFGTWNVHTSLLPRHRGASPIQAAILAGDPQTGVTLMELTEGLDEGPMLLKKAIALQGHETGGNLTKTLAEVGHETLLEGLKAAKSEGLEAQAQQAQEATYAPLLKKADGALDFTEPARALERRVRALDPWPGAFTTWNGQRLKVLEARVSYETGGAPGSVVSAKKSLIVQTQEQSLEILRLQPPGKKPMETEAFLRGAGRHIEAGTPLG